MPTTCKQATYLTPSPSPPPRSGTRKVISFFGNILI